MSQLMEMDTGIGGVEAVLRDCEVVPISGSA
jgi:hypothetical protein